MRPLLMWIAARLLDLLVLVVLPLLLITLAGLVRFSVLTVLPALLLIALAVLSGMARTAGLLLLAVVGVLRLVFTGLDRLGERAPAPRLPVGVGR